MTEKGNDIESQFQSTLLQEERQREIGHQIKTHMISIHAPTRGATDGILRVGLTNLFQSTLLQEERLLDPLCLLGYIFISIHAPTRGATSRSALSAWLYIHFNPRSYKRSDSYERCYRCHLGNFNPRSYKRSDGKNAQLSLYLSVIIIA